MPPFTLIIQDLPPAPDATKVKMISFDGQLDEMNIEENAPKIYDMIENSVGKTIFIFDFERLSYMNSKSVGFIADWNERLNKKGGYIAVVIFPPDINDIMTTVGITDFIKEYPTLADAKDVIYR